MIDSTQVDDANQLHVVGRHFTEKGTPVLLGPTRVHLPGTIVSIIAGIDATVAIVDE